ncbi:hypothetical protein DRQ33_02795, partial [bacterium]
MKYSNKNMMRILSAIVLSIVIVAHAQSTVVEQNTFFPKPAVELPDVIYAMNANSSGESSFDYSRYNDDDTPPPEPLETMAGDIPFFEGFENTAFPPTGWTCSSNVTRYTSSSTYIHNGIASCRFQGGGTRTLEKTAVIDVSGDNDIVITCWLKDYGCDNGERMKMYYKLDSGSWIEWANVNGTDIINWTEYHVDIDASAASNLYIRFEANANSTSEYWYLDDIQVVIRDVILTKDGSPYPSAGNNEFYIINDAIAQIPQTLDGVYVVTVNSDRTYLEQVDIFKYNSSVSCSLTIRAGDGYKPIVDGEQYGFYIKPFGSADHLMYVIVNGFEIKSTTSYLIYVNRGSTTDLTQYLTIKNCIIHDTGSNGLYFYYTQYLTFNNNIVYDTRGSYGLYIYYCDNSEFINNTVYTPSTSYSVYQYNGNNQVFRNNIICNASGISGDYGFRIYNGGATITYNYFAGYSAAYAVYGSSLPPEDHNTEVQLTTNPPYFVSTTSGSEDFHLQSATTGHWTGSDWSAPDANTSPCIDGGDPADDYSNEPAGNGDIINQGAYGNTSEATRTSIAGTYDDDSEVKQGAAAEPATISSTIDTETGKVFVFDFGFEDKGTRDGDPTKILSLKLTQGDGNDFADWAKVIAGAHLCNTATGTDLPTDLAGNITATDITFTIADPYISVADGTSETYQVKIWLSTDLPSGADNDNIEFKLDYSDISTSGSGSSFGSGSPETGNDKNAVDVQATKMYFDSYPPFYETSTNFTVQVSATDENDNRDEDNTSNVTLSLSEGTGSLSSVTGLVNKPLSSGTYTWSDVQYDGTDSIKIKIERVGGGLTAAISNYMRCLQGCMYFVNDSYDADDTYCSAAGNSGNDGLSPNTPKASIRQIINSYALGPNCIVWVDHGSYEATSSTEEFRVDSNDDGDATGYVEFKASPNGVVLDGYQYTVYLYDANYVIVDGFDITGASNDGVYIYRNSDFNKINHCNIYENGSSDYGVYVYNSSAAIPDSNEISYNNIADGNHGIYLASSSASYYGYGSIIHHNVVHDCSREAIYVRYNKKAEVYNNEAYSCGSSQNSGVYIYYGDSALVYNNKLHTGSTSNYGIRIENTNNAKVHNNIIYDTVYRGILNDNNSDNNEYYYNSIKAEDVAFYLEDCLNTIIKNNILWCTGSMSTDVSFDARSDTVNFDSDNNDLYAPDAKVVLYSYNYYNTLSDWQSASGEDINSISRDPLFVSASDLHLQDISPCIDSGTVVLSGYETDFDGDTRTTPTDIGADEKPPAGATDDAGITSIDAPTLTFCPGTKDIIVTLQNFAGNSLTYTKIRWAIDEGSGYIEQTPFEWNGNIDPYDSQSDIDIGDYTFSSGVVCSIMVWTSEPNHGTDPDNGNDTSYVNYIGAGFNGAFTIGGASPSFPNFTQAVNAITQFGVCGATIFNVRNGTYTERISIPQLIGASAVNTVTFQSENDDSSLVTLTQAATGVDDNYTVKLAGADYLTFQDMTIQSTGAVNASYSTVIEINDSSCNNRFLNNQLFGHVDAGHMLS